MLIAALIVVALCTAIGWMLNMPLPGFVIGCVAAVLVVVGNVSVH